MICEKCGVLMKEGKVSLGTGCSIASGLVGNPAALFMCEGTVIDSLGGGSYDGFYCPVCGEFSVSFRIKKNVLFEKGYDMELDEDIDCLPMKNCPECGESIDIDYPKCPECGYRFEE